MPVSTAAKKEKPDFELNQKLKLQHEKGPDLAMSLTQCDLSNFTRE